MRTKSVLMLFLITILSFNAGLTFAKTENICCGAKKKFDTTIFPKPKSGFKMVTIDLPKIRKEQNHKVEIFVGIEAELDCNNYFLIGNISQNILEQWGYTYFTVESNGEMGGTRMICPDGQKQLKFVHIQPLLVDYSSKVPIVIYLPQNMKVKYKIWRTNGKLK